MMKYIHYGSSELTPILFNKNLKDNELLNKPNGGLWASPIGEEYFTWKDWCEENDFHLDSLNESFTFELRDPSKIFTIKRPEDIIKLDKLGLLSKGTNAFDTYYINWNKMVKLYDGVQLIHGDDYYAFFHDVVWFGFDQNQTELEKYAGMFYSWDVDSIIIWNESQIIITENGKND